MTGLLTRERMLDAIEAQATLVRYALAGGVAPDAGDGAGVDLATSVPSCPDWTLHELVTHLGTANWFGAANVRAANPDERARGMRGVQESAPAATDGPAALASWYAGLIEQVIAIFTASDPDAPVWTFAGPGRAGYWLRRQLHETVVHRWDLESALGASDSVTPLPEDVAVDTVDEFCASLRPLLAALGSVPPATIRLRGVLQAPEGLVTGAKPVGSADLHTDLEWVVPGTEDAPEVQVAGPPETLALLLWGRVDPDVDGLRITGDRAALDAAMMAGLSP